MGFPGVLDARSTGRVAETGVNASYAQGAHGETTPMQPASGIAFRAAPSGYVLDWHCAPRQQYSISLSGAAEIEVGDGTVARIEPGDVVLAEDLTGRGHVTRVVGTEPRLYAIGSLTEEVARP